jgi:multidrug resistance efflux pump
MFEKSSKIDLLRDRSDQVQEILGSPSRLPIVVGQIVIITILFILLLFSWLIKYPDKIDSEITITTNIPPVSLITRASGKIKILVKKDSLISQNSTLFIIENEAIYSDVVKLKNLIDSIEHNIPKEIYWDKLTLGNLQQDYGNFLLAAEQVMRFTFENPVQNELLILKKQILQQENLLKKQITFKNTYLRQYDLFEKDYIRQQKLFQQKVIAAIQLEEKEKDLIQSRSIVETAELNIENGRTKLLDLNSQQARLLTQDIKEKNSVDSRFKEAINTIKSAIIFWEQKYLIKSPISGKIAFLKYWNDNQYTKEGEEIAVIVPINAGKIIGRVKMPISNSGKVRPGQKVNIYLNNFPAEEFGILIGSINRISLVPRDGLYYIDVDLSKNLKTTYNKRLEFRQEMQGKAEIITEDLRLLERIFYQLRKIFI